jgi:hypothetical protein
MKLALASILAAAAGLAACTEYYPPPPPPGVPVVAVAPPPGALPPDLCFRSRDIRNHTLGGDRTLYLNVNDRMVYRVEMNGACFAGAVQSDPIITREPPGSSIVCRPIDLDVSINKGGFTTPCIVGSIAPMTAAEVAALPPRMRP